MKFIYLHSNYFYLRQFTTEEAISYLKDLRPFVILDKSRQIRAMRSYYDYLYGKKWINNHRKLNSHKIILLKNFFNKDLAVKS